MPRHHLSEAELSLPHGWQDQSVTSYVLPRPGDPRGVGEATLVVTRDYEAVRELPAGEGFLDRYADRQLVESARRLTKFECVGRSAAAVGGRRALVVDTAWTLPDGQRVRQRQAFVRLGDRVLVFTLTARADDFDKYAGLWAEVAAGVQWRPGAGLPSIVMPPGPTPGGDAPGGRPSA